jgi:midasin
VLEPSRPLVLAEKGSDLLLDEVSSDSTEVKADDDPDPGGDFGKRELTPALRSRFTEIWVHSVIEFSDIELVLLQNIMASVEKYQMRHISESYIVNIKQSMLDYVNWFNKEICSTPMSVFADFVLSLRDVLAWARFVMETSCNNTELSTWSPFAHGASLMHLDSLGLGIGLSREEASQTKTIAKEFLRNAIPKGTKSCCI